MNGLTNTAHAQTPLLDEWDGKPTTAIAASDTIFRALRNSSEQRVACVLLRGPNYAIPTATWSNIECQILVSFV